MPPGSVSDARFDPQSGHPVPVAEHVVRVTAPNASAYTFTGTNSFLIGNRQVAVLDPGPDDARHRQALLEAIGGRRVTSILLTHTHRDHSAGALKLAAEVNAPLWFGGRHRLSRPLKPFEHNRLRRSSDWDLVPDRTLVDGDIIPAGDQTLTVHTTPGHCANHLAFGLGDTLFSGDHVMGWNSTLVAVPDGSMADYLASLDKVIALPYGRYLPAHGDAIADGPEYAARLREHRQLRNKQVLAAVSEGARTISRIVRAIYPAQPLPVRIAAAMTIRAHVEYLVDNRRLRAVRMPLGLWIRPA